MQAIHDLLMSMTATLFAIACIVLLRDMWHEVKYRRSVTHGMEAESPSPSRWRVSVALALVAWIPLLVALGIVIFTSGRIGVRMGVTPSVHAQTYAGAQRFAVSSRPSRVPVVHGRHR
jgi:heme/copper-type cytochrome/quinol oxidase subunit 2